MKEGLRFDMSSGRLEKDSISLGCSVVRKNVDKNEKEKKNKKTKKRPRLILSDSGSDNDFFISPRKNVNSGSNQVQVGSNNGRVVKNNSVYSCNDTIKIEVDRKRIKPELVKYRKDGEFSRNKVAEAGNNGNSRMDVFEYNEDDLVDDRKMKKKVVLDDYDNEGGGLMRRYGAPGSKSEQCGKWRELKTESSRDVVETSNRSKFYRYSDSYPKNDIGGDYLDRKRLKVSKDDSFRQVSKGKEYELPSGEPVRIRGKNGVLKLTIKTKKVDEPDRNYEHVEAEESKKVYRSSVTKGELHPSIYKDKILQNAHSVGVTEKNQMNLEKYSLTKKKTHNVRTEDCQKFVVRGSTSSKTCSSNKNGKDIGNSNLASEFYPSTRRKVGEVRRGTGTQKQLIRERIRRMLEKAGWKIEFRPRKNRNYQDAVYTNPSGTEYWSILNAYYALKKEHEAVGRDDENTGASPSFTPLSEEVLSLLTRQTTKKIEREERMMNRVHEGSTSDKESVRKNSVNDMRRNENGFLSQNTKFVGKSQKYIHPSDAKGYGYRVKKPSCAPDGHLVQGKKSKKQNRCSLLVRTSKKGVNADGNDFVPSIRRSTILSWLIDLGIVSVGEKVKYMNKRRTHTLLRGWIARDGVHCGCCSKILTVSKFEIHAGSKSRQSYQNICVQSGDSLLQCQLDAWDGQDESKRSGFCLVDVYGDDPNDDTCGICADGGDLICCDGCPSTFHQSCLCMKVLPPGDWHCPNCSCKFCGLTGTNFQGDDHVDSELLTCSSCEEKYHPFCIQQTNNAVVDYKNSSTTFCSHQCGELFEKLQKLLWVKHELKAGFSWTLIRRCDLDSDTSFPGLPIKAECNSKLAVALTVMDECFFPIVDRRSGVRLIDNVIYSCGSNFNRLNFTGFYTAVLERGDEIISAASIRIHGTRLAEMPFIGTRHIYRRQGMCRRLLNAIESALCSLKVEKLIIPAISELMHAWTTVFGFKPLKELDKEEMRSLNMLMFPGTDLLQKWLKNPEENVTSNPVLPCFSSNGNCST